jgi:phage virion morphogenesis protein
MSDIFTITVDDAQVTRWFKHLIDAGTNLRPLMRDIGEALLESTQKRFSDGVAPNGEPWKELADGSKAHLVQSGRMMSDIHPTSGDNWVMLTASARQAAYHQFGTGPYTIEPKKGKYLYFKYGGHLIRKKQVNHPGLPARPFMGISQDDDDLITRLALAHLTGDN